MDHYLTVRRWELDFKPSEASKVATALWVRFPQLPIENYNEKVLFHIAKAIDKPLKIDLNIAMSAREKYAHVCVEVDLTKPLISRFVIGKYRYIVEYEHLHYFCFHCGKVRHRKEYCSSKPAPKPVKATSEVAPNDHEAGSHPIPTVSSSRKQPTASREQLDEFGPWMLVNRRNNRPHPMVRQTGPNTTNSIRSANRFGPLAASGSMGGPKDKAKHKSPMDPDMDGAYSHAPSFEAGNPTTVNKIYSDRQQDERQPIQDKTTASKGQDRPVTPATSSTPSLVQATCEAPSLMVTETTPPNPSSSPFDPIPVQIPVFPPPSPSIESPNTSTVTFDLKQKPPDNHNEHLQPLQYQRGPGDSSSSNYQDAAQLGGIIPQTRERSHSPSKHRVVDTRDKVEYRAQVDERGRKTSASNTDGNSKAIRAIQKDSE
ncbi:hypothetical protein ACSBR1_023266 [Camellia fascicularis]